MKKVLSFIRWKFVIPTVLVVAGILVFFIIFFDPLLARTLESVGSKVNGAKVEVSGLDTQLFKGRIAIKRVQVTDKNNTMKNMVDVGPLAFQLDLSSLLSKCVIIPEASVQGLLFNTDRKRDGRLRHPPKKPKDEKPSAADKLTDKYKDQFKLKLDSVKADTKAKIEFDPKTLHLTQEYEQLKLKSDALPEEWKKKYNDLKIDDRLKKIEQLVKEVQNTPTSGSAAFTEVPKSLKKLNEAKSEMNKIKSDLKGTKEQLQSELKGLKSDLASLQEAKKKDVAEILSRLNLDFANPKALANGLVGGAMLEKVKSVLKYAALIRKHMPSKKEQQLPEKPRSGGMDIRFPTPAAPPRFWLKKASLSGQFQDISAAGMLTHATSDPARVGQPLKLDLKGSQGQHLFTALVVADHVKEVSKDSLSIQAKNLQVKELISGGTFGEALSAGQGDMDLSFQFTGESAIGGNIALSISGLKLNDAALLKEVGIQSTDNLKKEEALKASFVRSLARGMEQMPVVKISAVLKGTWDNPDFDLNTNLDDMFKKVIKESVGNVVNDQKKELEAQLNTLLASRESELNAKIAQLQPKLAELLGGHDKAIQDQINKLTKAGVPGADGGSSDTPIKFPNLNKLFKK